MPPPVKPRNDGGPFEFVVDAESDLASVNDPQIGQFALALAEGSLHFHTGSVWQEISGGVPGSALNVAANTAYYTRYAGLGVNLDHKYKYAYSAPNGTFTETALIDEGFYWVVDWAGTNGSIRSYDTSSWLRTTTYSSTYWAGTIPANTMFELPKGWYIWQWSLRLMGDPVPDTSIEPYLDYGDYPASGPFSGEFMHFADEYSMNDLLPVPRFVTRVGFTVVTVDNTIVIPTILLSTGAENNAGIDYLSFIITRIAEGT